MKYKLQAFLILSAIFIFSNCASINAKRYNKTKEQINIYEAIKQYPLLVRLQTSERKIKLLRKNGRELEAVQEENATDSLNNLILSAFTKHFDFAKVYFFYSTHGKKLKDGAYTEVPFFDGDKNPVSDLEIEENHYFVSEFSKSYSEMHVRENEDGSSTMVAGSNPYPAVVIMNPDYIPIKNIATNGIYAFRNPYIAIREMDTALKRGLAKSSGKLQKLELKMKMSELRNQ